MECAVPTSLFSFITAAALLLLPGADAPRGAATPSPTPARATRAREISSADSVLHAVETYLRQNLPAGVKYSNLQLQGLAFVQGEAKTVWGDPIRKGPPKFEAGALQQFDRSVADGVVDPGRQSYTMHLEHQEDRTWSFTSSRTQVSDLHVSVQVTYPIGGVGQLKASSDFRETVTTFSSSTNTESDHFQWAQDVTNEVAPNTTMYGILTIARQPFSVPWSTTVAATGRYVFFVPTSMDAIAVQAALRRVDDSVDCNRAFGNLCMGTIWKLVPWRDRAFPVSGELTVEYGISVKACSETVKLRQPPVLCKAQ